MTQISTQRLAVWITEQARTHNVSLESLDAPTVAKQANVTPEEATAAIAEAIRVNTAALRSQITPANVSQGGARLQMNTPQALQARITPQQHFQAAQLAFSRGDYASEALHLADYWNAYAGGHVLSRDLVPTQPAPANAPHAALFQRLPTEAPHVRLQLVRDFLTPKPQPDLMSRVTSGLGKLMSNPQGLMMMMNPTAALFGMVTQQASAPTPKPMSLDDSLMAKASTAYHQHRAANRPYPDATIVTPLVQRFSAAVEGLDDRMRGLLISAFELALQRGDGQAIDQLATRAETLAKEQYDAKLKAALT